ncbi:MAG TPA: hypothetical protein VMH87_19325 [Pseudomonadales bacterium]|nr:hypothetical protein [Pseudomonadales bacterium]
MRFFNASPACVLQLFLLAGMLFFSGCATAPEELFTVSGPGWTMQQGQALWTPRQGAPQIGGDIVLATDANGRALVQFEKMPVSLVTAQVTPEAWTIRFPQGGGFWKGHQPAPTRTIWLYLPAALTGKPLPEPLQFSQEHGGNWRLENPKTGEILEGFVSP